MLLKQLILKNFRNFDSKSLLFSPFLTVVIGENARGKTNILEGIYFVCNGHGFRESKEDELISFGKEVTEVEGKFAKADETLDFKIMLRTRIGTIEKSFFVSNTKRKSLQYKEDLAKTVLFNPEQIDIITGPPDTRRSYFDTILSIFDFEYKKKLTNYENALRKRNKVLEHYKSIEELKEELTFWDDYLVEQALYISQKRKDYVDFLNLNQKIQNRYFSIEYLNNPMTKEHLKEAFNIEIRYRKTFIGPQKDDFQLYHGNHAGKKNLHHFGSRSEQRLGVFWLKLNEIKHFEKKMDKKPLLLLDDVFSELDLKNKKLVIDLIQKYQTVITTTEVEMLDLSNMPKTVINL